VLARCRSPAKQQEMPGQGPAALAAGELARPDRFEPVRLRSPALFCWPATGSPWRRAQHAKGGSGADGGSPEPGPRSHALRDCRQGERPATRPRQLQQLQARHHRFQAPRRGQRRCRAEPTSQAEPAQGRQHAFTRRRCRRHASSDAVRPPQSPAGHRRGQQRPAGSRRMQAERLEAVLMGPAWPACPRRQRSNIRPRGKASIGGGEIGRYGAAPCERKPG